MSRPDPWEARHRWFDAARNAGPIWQIFAGLLVIEVIWDLTGSFLVPFDAGEAGTDGTLATLGVHLAFLVLAIATAGVVARFQRRSPLSVLGPLRRVSGDFLRVVRGMAVFFVVITLIPGTDWSEIDPAMNVFAWVLLLPIACLAVLIQTGAEEYLFRGYLQQSLGARRDHALLWMAVPSVLFGLSHYNPDIAWDATLAHMIWTAAFGVAAADLTARTGALGAAVGLHFAFNLPLVIFYAVPGEMAGFSLLALPESWADTPQTPVTLAFDLFYLWMLWMVCRIAIRR